MQLSLQFLYIQIKQKVPDALLECKEGINPYCRSIRLLTDYRTPILEDMLYLHPENFYLPLSPLQKTTAPLILKASQKSEFHHCPKILVPDSNLLYPIFNDILEIFQRYQTWAEDVNQAILMNKSLQDILEITESIIDNPMYIADLSFKMLAWLSKDMEEMSIAWRYQVRYGYLPYNIMMDLLETGELDLLNNTSNAFYLQSKCFSRDFISKTIRYQGKIQGHFFIIEAYHGLTQCEMEIAEYLGELLSNATYNKNNYLTISSFYHEHFMIDILEKTLTDITLISHQLNPLGWQIEGDFSLFLLSTVDDDDALRRSLMSFLTDTFDAQSFLYHDYLLIVFHENSDQKERLLQHLQKLILLFNRKGALSENFTRFDQISYYYEQAVFALEFGNKLNPKQNFFKYEEYFLSHMTHLTRDEVTFYRPVEQLDTFDSQHHTEYCRTLYIYLQNERNAMKTARHLYLHRNTLKYRLEKIFDILNLESDLDNPMIRLRVLFSLHTLERLKEELIPEH